MGSDVVLLTKYCRPWQVMAQQGAALQTYNNELVKSLEELQARRQILQQQIEADMKEKAKLEDEKRVVEERLGKVSHSLGAKLAARKEYDRVIGEAEQAYTKILESSQVLLNVIQSRSQDLRQTVQQPPKAEGFVGNHNQVTSSDSGFHQRDTAPL